MKIKELEILKKEHAAYKELYDSLIEIELNSGTPTGKNNAINNPTLPFFLIRVKTKRQPLRLPS